MPITRHKSTTIRRGMWIVVDGRVGIAHTLLVVDGDDMRIATPDDEHVTHAEVHYVDAVGDTVLVAVECIDALSQSPLAAIPQTRRPSPELAQAMGYR